MIKTTPYRKFIILSSPRSGTHMLRTALRNHPNVTARSELFNPDFLKDKEYNRHTPERTILNDFIYRSCPRDIKSVGFIIHRSGTPWGDWPDLWEMLQADKSIYVISLRRRNLLRRYLSYQTMRTFRGSPPKPLTFDPVILEQDFEYQEQEIEQFDRNFAGHPLLKVYYEDLCVEYHSTLRKVQKFLQVKPQKIWTDMEGKPIRKLSEAIANYSELSDYFANTRWADFFNDEEQVIHVSKPSPKKEKKKELSDYYSLKFRNTIKEGYDRIRKGKTKFYEELPLSSRSIYARKWEELIARSFFQDRRKGVFLDVGCARPFQVSNTCYLEKHLGWSGIGVDANPLHLKHWKKYRQNTKLFKFIVTDHNGTIEKFYKAGDMGSVQKERQFGDKVIRGKEVQVPTITLTKLLEDNALEKIDFLSMDIEGSESKALSGFDMERFRPDLVCIERSRKPETKAEVLAYFELYRYKMLTEFKLLDILNWYFAPI